MNLPLFLNKVDVLTSQLSHTDLEEYIHEMARTLPEARRDDFLSALEGLDVQAAPRKTGKDAGYGDLLADIEVIKGKLNEINEGERCLDSEYNEEWDDWYNSDADEVLFSDSEGVLDDINAAAGLVHRCIDAEAYKEGCELAEILAFLEVMAEGDYNDFDGTPLGMRELDEYGLLSYDFKTLEKECVYLAYMGNTLEDRPEEIFFMVNNFQCYDVSLENILQTGKEELPEFDEFLKRWIAYLGAAKGRHAGELLREAQAMLQDEDEQIENARKYVENHPSLYKQLLEMKLESGKAAEIGENEKMFGIGREALDKIPRSRVVRSQIALLTAEYACKLQDKAAMEDCWLEAFRSNSTVVNYLRIRMRTENWGKYEGDVKAIYEQAYEESEKRSGRGSVIYDMNGQGENDLHKPAYLTILFFEGQFDRMIEIGMKEKEALGWSSTFMKQGLALLLLLLYDGKKLQAGTRAMSHWALDACEFKAGEYFKRTGAQDKEENYDVFWKLFCRWKENIQVSEVQRKEWLDKIDKWIELRVSGIMNKNRRNYYGECASYIAALGEVQESLGTPGAKARIMEKYKCEYSRRSAFHQELRGYGMKK